ncbi:MAG TPA: LptA/OstA family protein [Terracidiphilus sp.]|nr:LptA/OstA family protein [Terracidiphilus sp.]
MRLTIERLRTLVLVTGGLLVVALAAFLALGHWKNRLSLRDIPKRLGANIERQQDGVVYTQSSHGHMVFKLKASKVVQLKKDGRALLNDVEIELYGKDGETVDRIRGRQFEWDTAAKKATAAGPVEILIMQPMATPAVAEGVRGAKPAKPKTAPAPLSNPAKAAAQSVAKGQIDVKTSGLTFDSDSGAAATAARVEFSTAQGSGSSEGATFDSGNGTLVLDHAVELNVRRGEENVLIHAQHAEFDRDQRICTMSGADAQYRGGEAKAGQAQVLFREDGSAVRLDAHDGIALTTATGTRIASPVGSLLFNERNQPQQGRLEGGVTLASSGGGREASGSAPQAVLSFSSRGELRHAHLERGVILHSAQDGSDGVRVTRDWRSPVADVEFRTTAQRHTEIAQAHGTGGVVITGLTQRAGSAAAPSRMTADDVTGVFGPGQQLAELVGVGHASLEQTSAAPGKSQAQQTTSGDRIDARFAQAGTVRLQGSQQIQSALIDGNVVMTDQEPAKPGEAAPALMRVTAGHAVYEGAGQWLHLTASPRVEEGGLGLTADKVDVSQASGDAFAHGNVKATWAESGKGSGGQAGGMGLGGDGPAHVIAAEAEMHRAADEATFKGKARLWQGANSVSAPVIVLNRTRQTLEAHGNGKAQPVNLVLLTAGGPADKEASSRKQAGPQVVSVRAGDLRYSAAERRAVLEADGWGNVVAQNESATVTAHEAELTLLPPGNHAGSDGHAGQVDRMTARGHVVIESSDRHGTGEMLVYTSDTGHYVLTGTAEAPPRLTDPMHGTVTGNALIFNTRDDSVSIEGRGQKTSTETAAPK